MTQPPERRGGRRRLREPDESPATPPPSRRPDPRDTGRQAVPPRTSGRHELPQPSANPRRAQPPAEGGGRRRRLEPPETLRPVDDYDPQAQRAAPARAAHARHGLDESSEDIQPGASRRRRAPEPPPAATQPPARPQRRHAQPGDRPVGMPAEPPRRPARRPEPPPVRVEPPTDVIPVLTPPPPPPPAPEPVRTPPAPAEDEYDEYDDYDDEYDEYDDAAYDDYDGEEEYEDEPYEDELLEEQPPKKKKKRKRGKRFVGWVAAIAVIALLAGGAWFGVTKIFGYDDFEGAGTTDVLFQIADGDSTSAIGTKLANAGIVASSKAFVKAGEGNAKVTKLQHGYYVMKQHMSGASAVDKITAADSRVGQMEIRAYTQFDDITQPDGKITPGVFTQLSKASCADLNGKSTCIPVEELRKTVAAADPKALGVPSWAIDPASKTERKDTKLEGLIAPGVYDMKPGSTATELLTDLVKLSSESILNAGLSDKSTGEGKTPYETLIIASIIEREAVKADFGKISRVIYNRLAISMRLQMDSTVNYVLDRPTLLTNEADRVKAGAYNTYKIPALPPSPISVPSPDAIQAALHPTAGDWIYFVKCETNGLSCFAATNDEHNKNRDLARSRGVI